LRLKITQALLGHGRLHHFSLVRCQDLLRLLDKFTLLRDDVLEIQLELALERQLAEPLYAALKRGIEGGQLCRICLVVLGLLKI
jgi:hypothetical protein